MQGNLCGEGAAAVALRAMAGQGSSAACQGVARRAKPGGHISPMPGWGNAQDMVKGRTCVSREEPSGLDMAMKPTGRANSGGA
jgi:hypothetical protein